MTSQNNPLPTEDNTPRNTTTPADGQQPPELRHAEEAGTQHDVSKPSSEMTDQKTHSENEKTNMSNDTYTPSNVSREQIEESQKQTLKNPNVDQPPQLSNMDFHATMDIPSPVNDYYCPYCKAEQYSPNDPFCFNCGSPLHNKHDKCRNCKTRLIPAAQYCFHCGVRIEPVPEITLHLVDTNVDFQVPADADLYIVGRTVPQQGIYVDLDLGEYGQRRISRQHARFVLKENKWYLEDLGSRAGTRIYNRRLEPHTPVRVEDSMVVYFADLKFKIDMHE